MSPSKSHPQIQQETGEERKNRRLRQRHLSHQTKGAGPRLRPNRNARPGRLRLILPLPGEIFEKGAGITSFTLKNYRETAEATRC
jgi:hypothetical protein